MFHIEVYLQPRVTQQVILQMTPYGEQAMNIGGKSTIYPYKIVLKCNP